MQAVQVKIAGGVFAGGLVALAIAGVPHLAAGATRPADVKAVTLVPAHISMVIVPAVHFGPDKKKHDAFTPNNFSALTGQKVIVTVYNYDTGEHSFTAPGLHLNATLKGARRNGSPAATTFTFTAPKAGVYSWFCARPCDTEAHSWAMAHTGYVSGVVTITAR